MIMLRQKIANPEPIITVQDEEYIYGIGNGLVAHYSFDNDINNVSFNLVGKNNGSIYGSTVAMWKFDNPYYSPLDSASYANNGKLMGNTIGLWHFDEGAGSTTKDETGYVNNGTINGATWMKESPKVH
jgi:hypothetical protein